MYESKLRPPGRRATQLGTLLDHALEQELSTASRALWHSALSESSVRMASFDFAERWGQWPMRDPERRDTWSLGLRMTKPMLIGLRNSMPSMLWRIAGLTSLGSSARPRFRTLT